MTLYIIYLGWLNPYFEHVNGGWNTYFFNLNLSMHFRAGFRGPVKFKMKIYVTTANSNFQPLLISLSERAPS